jgi:hypothetical protein
MQLIVRIALMALMLGISSAVVSADDPTQRIVFAPGQTAITMKGGVTGYRSLRYLMYAQAGQVLSITFTSTKKTLRYDVTQGNQRLRDGSDGSFDDWSALVPEDGDCVIDVYFKSSDAKKNAEATFALTVSLTAQ